MTGQHPSAPYPTPTTMPPDTLVSQTAGSPVCSLAYDGRLLTTYPRLAVGDLYGTGYPEQAAAAGYMAGLATNPTVIYPTSLTSPYDMKDPRAAWATLPQAACYPCDPTLATYGAYGDRFDPVDSEARRRNATRETTSTLKAWLNEHRKNPYPTKGEKIMLAIITKMTLTQVSTWFANARRRLKKENKMTWEPRNKTGDDLDDVSVDEDEGKIDAKDGEEQDDEDQGKTEEQRNGEDEIKAKERKSDLSDDPRKPPPQRSITPPLPPMARSPSIPNSPDANDRASSLSPRKDIKSSVDDPLTLIRPTKLGGGGTVNEKPKIWSLARTATSSSPPPIRRSPFSSVSPTITGDCDDRTRLNRLLFHERMLPTDLSSSSSSSHRHNQQRGESADFRTRSAVHDSSAESSLSSSPLWPSNDGVAKSDRLSSGRLTPFDASDVVSVSSSSSCSPSLLTSHPDAGRPAGLAALSYSPARLLGCRLLQCGQDPTVGVDPFNSALSYRSNDRYVPHSTVGATLDLRTIHSPLMRPPVGCPVNFSATALHRTKIFQVDVDSSLSYRSPSHNGDGDPHGERDSCKANTKSKAS